MREEEVRHDLKFRLNHMIKELFDSVKNPFYFLSLMGPLNAWAILAKSEALPDSKKSNIAEFKKLIESANKLDKFIEKSKGVIKENMREELNRWIFWDRICKARIDNVSWYIRRGKRKLEGIAKKAKIGDRLALMSLIAFDPIWLYESWVRNKVLDALRIEDRNFFSLLGTSIANRQKKYFKPVSSNSKITQPLKENIFLYGYLNLPSSNNNDRERWKVLLKALDAKGISDAEKGGHTAIALKKMLKDHCLFLRPTAYKQLSTQVPFYGPENARKKCFDILSLIDDSFIEFTGATSKVNKYLNTPQ